MPRPIYQIASDISRDWKRPHYAAVPYLAALRDLEAATDIYGCESGTSCIRYFLSNAGGYRGGRAAELKAELRAHLLGGR